jgi:hypothetical protein
MAKMTLLNFVAAAISISTPALGGLFGDTPAPKKTSPPKTVKTVAPKPSAPKVDLVRAELRQKKVDNRRLMT